MFIVTRRRRADLRQEVHVYSHAAQMCRPPSGGPNQRPTVGEGEVVKSFGSDATAFLEGMI